MAPESVLVTGSSGTIGTELVGRLLDDGYDVTGTDVVPNRWDEAIDDLTVQVDLTDPAATSSLPTDVDLVVHLAANARVHKLVQDPTGARENFDVTFNLLDFARTVGADFVFASSREVYGNEDRTICSEDDTFVNVCESPYTASKIGGEALVKSYERCYDIETCILRFSNVYGRYDASDRVIPLFIAQAANGDDLTVFGDKKVLDFTYIDDCVSGIKRVLEKFHKTKGTTLNIASGRGTSIIELAELLRERVNPSVDIHVEPNRVGEVSRYIADISKARKLMGHEPSHTVKSGLDQTVEWYEANEHLYHEILE